MVTQIFLMLVFAETTCFSVKKNVKSAAENLIGPDYRIVSIIPCENDSHYNSKLYFLYDNKIVTFYATYSIILVL